MNLRQASQYLGVSSDTLYRYIGIGSGSGLQAGESLEVLESRAGPLDGTEDAPGGFEEAALAAR